MIDITLDSKKNKGIYSGKYFEEVKEFFSVKNDAAKFARNRFVPSRKYAITSTGRFDPCLLGEIIKFLEQKTEIKLKDIKIDPLLLEENMPSTHGWRKHLTFSLHEYELSLKLRDYQKDIVDKCLNLGRGTVLLATAGGKTLVMASLLSKVWAMYPSFKVCLIVPNRGLVEQTNNDFNDYKVPFTFSKWTGDDPLDLTKNVIICNSSILQSKKSDTSWMEFVDVLVIDECHHLKKDNEITKIVDSCKTKYKFGFTGTLPEDKMDQWSIIGKIGPIIYQKRSFELRDQKHVVPAIAQILEVHYNSKPIRSFGTLLATENYKNEINFIKNSKFRNNIIKKIAKNSNNNILILLDYLDHGDTLYDILKTELKDKEVFYIKGEVEVSEREAMRKTMECKNNVVCIAISKIFSTGINIKNLHYIVFAGGGKSKIKTLQSIGRGLRLHESKDTLYIVDIADQLHYGIQHQNRRMDFYNQEKISSQLLKIYEN